MQFLSLTPRQLQILDLIQHTIAQTGAPPTRAEIASKLGFKSPNAAQDHLKAIARKGVIELAKGTARGIRLCADAVRHINAMRGTHFALPLANMQPLMLPLIGRVAAGAPILAQAHIDQMFAIETATFSRTPDYLLRVRGMSMRDAGILDGDLLAVQSAQQAINGQIVVARLSDEVTVKRFHRSQQGIELHPANPDYDIMRIEHHDDFAIEGLAVGLLRSTL